MEKTSICSLHTLVITLGLLVATLFTPIARVQSQGNVSVVTQPFAVSGQCSGQFVEHTLEHVTTVEGKVVRLFESNGAGLAVNDLDNDGDLDLVLANLAGPNTLLWNEGNLTFRKQTFAHGDSRAVATVDVDGDGWLDVVFTRRTKAPTYWRNLLGEQPESAFGFAEQRLVGVDKPAYAMTWGDVDLDGDLDLATGSYDLALQMTLGDQFRFGAGAGLHYYEQAGGKFIRHFLNRHAQTLALLFFDVNGDGWQDIVAGNDFTMRDEVWLYSLRGWRQVEPFAKTTENTMSFDVGDVNNDGTPELFAADMMPYQHDATTLAAWQPVMDRMPHEMEPGDPQIMANVLQMRGADGLFVNRSAHVGVDASGWSWSSKFGDLDNDGYLDLYIVNGMIALDLFDHLPNNELVEENQVFHNKRGAGFVVMPQWKLNSTASGRGMSMADLDNDGDLDIVVNNLLSPSILFENQLCGGASLEVDLFWPQRQNQRALGAQLELRTDQGIYMRDVRAESGYLSGDPARVHFGFPQSARLQALVIKWPGGVESTIKPPPSGLLQVTR